MNRVSIDLDIATEEEVIGLCDLLAQYNLLERREVQGVWYKVAPTPHRCDWRWESPRVDMCIVDGHKNDPYRFHDYREPHEWPRVGEEA